MKFIIHRGTQEIGGSCVEVWTDTTRIVLDIGMPLVKKDGSEFDFVKYKDHGVKELIAEGVLPSVPGLYPGAEAPVDGVLISHPHIDHYGFSSFLNSELRYFLGEATHRVIQLTEAFTPQDHNIQKFTYFEKSRPFRVGDFTITPYWMDHSAFDAYAFLVEAGGKSLFYSGDFRGHGRKHKVFSWFTHNAPQNVDCLLMEGTQVERNTQKDKSETDIENELVDVFAGSPGINLVYTSGQNIDRLVSVYRACKRAGKTFVVDVYVASVLRELAEFAALPHPSIDFPDVRVIFPFFLSRRIAKDGQEKLLYRFKDYKITKEEIDLNPADYVMTVRPSMKFDLDRIPNADGGRLIYSMWSGYLKKSGTKNFVEYLKGRGFEIFNIHTSGHADLETLERMAAAINPQQLIPIHTFRGQDYSSLFNTPVTELKDGETYSV